VQLEAEVEGELQVVVAERVGDGRDQLVDSGERFGKGLPRRLGKKLGG
jgi:hypothetical protein